jgi:hypothetical protein
LNQKLPFLLEREVKSADKQSDWITRKRRIKVSSKSSLPVSSNCNNSMILSGCNNNPFAMSDARNDRSSWCFVTRMIVCTSVNMGYFPFHQKKKVIYRWKYRRLCFNRTLFNDDPR